MTIFSAVVINHKEVDSLRRQARAERQEPRERLRTADPLELLGADLSQVRTRTLLLQTDDQQESALPRLGKDEIAAFEDPNSIAVLRFARAVRAPVLVCFGCEPSQAFESRLRQSAKARSWRVHFYRLIGGYAIVELNSPWPGVDEPPQEDEPSKEDDNFLKSVGISSR